MPTEWKARSGALAMPQMREYVVGRDVGWRRGVYPSIESRFRKVSRKVALVRPVKSRRLVDGLREERVVRCHKV